MTGPSDDHRERPSASSVAGGFESEDAVGEVLEEGYLFELSYRVDGELRTQFVAPIEAYRPSMVPRRGPPAFRFLAVGVNERLTVRLPDVIDLQPVALEQLGKPFVRTVFSALAALATDDARQLSRETIEAAYRDGQDNADLDVSALAAIVIHQTQDVHGDLFEDRDEFPLDLAAQLPGLVALATPESPHCEAASECLADVAESSPDAALDAVPVLTTVAEDADTAPRRYAIYALACIAGEYPEQVYPAVDTLLEAITSPDQNVQTNASSALGRIASRYPAAAEPIVDHLSALLDSDAMRVRNNVCGLLAEVGQQHPATVVEYAGELVDRLDDPNHHTRINASIALLRADEANPEAVRDHHEQLTAALDDATPEVRANTCALIGSANAPVPVAKLRELRSNDPDETVRDGAAWALGEIE